MFKQFIDKILSNSFAVNIAKVIIVSSVGITTVTTSAYIFDKTTQEDKEDKPISLVNTGLEADIEADYEEVDTNTSPSKSESMINTENGVANYLTDIVTGATRVVEEILGIDRSSTASVDVNTSASKQNATTIGVTSTLIEDTTTSSSIKKPSSGTSYLSNYDDDENEDNDSHDKDNRKKDDDDHDDDDEDEEDAD